MSALCEAGRKTTAEPTILYGCAPSAKKLKFLVLFVTENILQTTKEIVCRRFFVLGRLTFLLRNVPSLEVGQTLIGALGEEACGAKTP